MRLAHRLIFLRHGETAWNAEGRMQGQLDVPLNARGRGQAADAGRIVRKLRGRDGGAGFDDVHFVSSPLSRATETMELARLELGLPREGYARDPRLMELTFGEWEGATLPEIRKANAAAAAERVADPWGHCPPGGENYPMLQARLTAWLETLDRETLVVSHGGVARALMHMLGDLPKERAPHAEIAQGRVLVFENARYAWV